MSYVVQTKLGSDRAESQSQPSVTAPQEPPVTSHTQATHDVQSAVVEPDKVSPEEAVWSPDPGYTVQDVATFLKAIYDGKSFTKTYDLIHGVSVTFRELSSEDAQICAREKTIDAQTCRFAAAVARYDNDLTNMHVEIQPISCIGYDNTRFATPIPELVDWLAKNLFKTESLFQRAEAMYAQFAALLSKLYDAARNPDFFMSTRTEASSVPS